MNKNEVIQQAKEFVSLYRLNGDDLVVNRNRAHFLLLEKGISPLLLAIAKWLFLSDNPARYEIAGSTCALCWIHLRCRRCPVAQKAEDNECRGTPYYQYVKNPTSANAQLMAEWLISLKVEIEAEKEAKHEQQTV